MSLFNSEGEIVGVIIKLELVLIVFCKILMLVMVFVLMCRFGIVVFIVFSVLSEVLVWSIILISFSFVLVIVWVILMFCCGVLVWIMGSKVCLDINLEKWFMMFFFLSNCRSLGVVCIMKWKWCEGFVYWCCVWK